jgi:signal transduction histidine kinase
VVRQEFVTNLSHELRTPLSILAGYLETLEDPNQLKGSEGKKIWAVMQRNCERLTLLVGDLLELSRMDSGQLELKKIARSPKEILQEVHEDWQRAFASKKVKLKLECPEKLPAVQVDSLRMGQIFSNSMAYSLVTIHSLSACPALTAQYLDNMALAQTSRRASSPAVALKK